MKQSGGVIANLEEQLENPLGSPERVEAPHYKTLNEDLQVKVLSYCTGPACFAEAKVIVVT